VQVEQNLVQQAKQGDKEAFAELYENYFDKIYRYIVIRMGNKTEAEDLTQQVFLKALNSIHSYKWKGAPFSAWLFRIAHNLLVDYLRKERKVVIFQLNDSLTSGGGNPQLLVERNLDIEHLISATKQLTKAQQEVLSLRFAGELPIAEVAKIMDRSEGAVKALQHSSIVALRKTLLRAEEDE
jgi:RNA polymerase sigma-70 factor (ECF subfamily)